MRIALVSDWYFPRKGGIETHLFNLATALEGAGATPVIVTSFPGEAHSNGIEVVRLSTPVLPFDEVALSPFLRSKLRAEFQRGRYEVVHLHPSIVAPVCLAGFLAAKDLGLPVVMTFHSKLKTLPWFLQAMDRLFKWHRYPMKITAVSDYVAREVRRFAPYGDVSILPNGFDADYWQEKAPKRKGKAGAPFKLVTSMRLQHRKRPLALLKIFRDAEGQLGASGQSLQLTIAGVGSLEARLKRVIKRHGLADRVFLAGWLDRDALRSLYHVSDAFIMPSTRESFCIAALEARAAGLPVIARRNTGLEEFILDGVNGWLAPDDNDMAGLIAGLATAPGKVGKAAGTVMDYSRYDWPNLVAEHLEIYEAVAQST